MLLAVVGGWGGLWVVLDETEKLSSLSMENLLKSLLMEMSSSGRSLRYPYKTFIMSLSYTTIPCTSDLSYCQIQTRYASTHNEQFKVSPKSLKAVLILIWSMLNAIQETLMTEYECCLCHFISLTSGLLCYSRKPHFWLKMFDWTHLRSNWPASVCLAFEGIIWAWRRRALYILLLYFPLPKSLPTK